MNPPSDVEEHPATVALSRTIDEPCSQRTGSAAPGDWHWNDRESRMMVEHPALERHLIDPPATVMVGTGPIPFTLKEQGNMPTHRLSLNERDAGLSRTILSQSYRSRKSTRAVGHASVAGNATAKRSPVTPGFRYEVSD